jgi:hypothetical protein
VLRDLWHQNGIAGTAQDQQGQEEEQPLHDGVTV